MTIEATTTSSQLSDSGFGGAANLPTSSTGDLSAGAEDLAELVRQWLALNPPVASRSGSNDEHYDTAGRMVPPSDRQPAELITGLKKWIGVIQGIDNGVFTAELSPIDHEGPDMVADFELELLVPDVPMVASGDVVYLTTRYIKGRLGYSTATTQIRLRRLGQWSAAELAEIKKRAGGYAAEFSRYAE